MASATSMTTMTPSGEQWTISHGDQEAVVVEVGGGLRTYRQGGRDVVAGYEAHEECGAGRGQLLMPWPNRIRDGKYAFGGRALQLALTEPARANASHGLVRWHLWELADRTVDSVRVTTRLRPQQGWAWYLDLDVTYRLADDGLMVIPRAINVGDTDAPFGFGAHPYLTLGEEIVDELTVTVPAETALDVDPDRLLPTGRSAVAGTDRDLRDGQVLGPRRLDTAYTGLAADGDGRWRVRLRRGDRAITVWADAAAYPWLQVFTGDSLPPGRARRSGVAVEPMTCPPDAFNSGDDLLVLAPGQEFAAEWGISPA